MMAKQRQQSADELSVRKRVSIVWQYFEKLSKFRVRCNLCQHEQNYQSTTGNILRHLKSKHNIDATIKGQKEVPPTTIMMPKLERKNPVSKQDGERNKMPVHVEDNEEDSEKDVVTPPSRTLRDSRTKINSYCEDDDDPYAEESIHYEEYMVGTDVPSTGGDINKDDSSRKRRTLLEEQRIIAETEYFREKAAYFRMQKNLTALQAKKVKYELDQLNN